MSKIEELAESCRWDLSRGVPGTVLGSGSSVLGSSIFKTLMTNACRMDCRYCGISCMNKKHSYEPNELARLFLRLWSGGQAEGLFLSSGIPRDADTAMEMMIEASSRVRKGGFQGYIHLKVLPGCAREMVKRAAEVADRLSINMEAPSGSRLSELTGSKDFSLDILRRMEWIARTEPRAGHTTQLVVGAGDETDLELLEAVDGVYDKFNVKRAYYSPFKPMEGTPLEDRRPETANRIKRLYSADFLMRKYGVELKELEDVMVDEKLPPGDPKAWLAMESGPTELDKADFEDLIKVPGMGPGTARAIDYLKGLGLDADAVVPKKARPFLVEDSHKQSRLDDY